MHDIQLLAMRASFSALPAEMSFSAVDALISPISPVLPPLLGFSNFDDLLFCLRSVLLIGTP